MPNKNYQKGVGFEARFIAKLLKTGEAIKAGRFYASKGITDVWWVDKQGQHNEAQLKYSSQKKPYISPHELITLSKFAKSVKTIIPVWLVLKQSRKPTDRRLIL